MTIFRLVRNVLQDCELMFKKRERPNSASARQRTDGGDGSSGAVPTGDGQKKMKFGAATSSSAGSTESGLIGASSRKSDVDAAAKLEKKQLDTTLSGLKAQGIRAAGPADDITRRLNVDTEEDQDNRTVQERNLEIHKGLKDGTLEAGVYRGLGAYKKYAEMSEGKIANAKYTGLLGPTRNTMSNVRSTMRVEYWGVSGDGGICKDYKETGYCGYGDSCKFMHDRGDYKQGFHLDKEWDAKQKKIEEEKKKRWEKRTLRRAKLVAEGKQPGEDDETSSEENASDSDDELPSACPACDLKWEACSSIPIQTQCGHHFCEDCAMTHYAKTPTCMTCQNPTHGIFNSCDSLEAKIKQKKQIKAENKAKKENKSGPACYSLNADTDA